MASPLEKLISDGSRYQKSFQLYLENSSVNEIMDTFINNQLPQILDRTQDKTSHLNIIGVGSGSGEIDLKILSMLHERFPEGTVEQEVVEPNPEQLRNYTALVSQNPGLDYITFTWNQMTAEEFEEHWKEKKMKKKVDFIHMFQMLYYVTDYRVTINFYRSLLQRNGKLLISLITGDSGWGKLAKTYSTQFGNSAIKDVSIDVIKMFLDSEGVSYRVYKLPCQFDITACFTEGEEKGELLLDFLTEVLNFGKTASPALKAEFLEFLRLECSVETNSKVLFNSDFEVLVVDPLI